MHQNIVITACNVYYYINVTKTLQRHDNIII